MTNDIRVYPLTTASEYGFNSECWSTLRAYDLPPMYNIYIIYIRIDYIHTDVFLSFYPGLG